jgi:phosphopantetheinyl transferase
VRFFGPPPPPGKAFECIARVKVIDHSQLMADTQLVDNGQVWGVIEGAIDRRFDSHPTARPAERFPERYPMSLRQPEGWTMVFDAWTDLVTQGMAAHGILGSKAAVGYDRHPGKGKKQWLLGRIAAKDAVRFRQWDEGHTDVYPIELTVANDANGRPRVHNRPGRGLVDCDVSLAHAGDIGVAIAKPWQPGADRNGPGVGIDVAEITEHPAGTFAIALSDTETALMKSLSAADGSDSWLWFTRFWAAKEAVAKAEGTGFDGKPRRFTVTEVAGSEMKVTVGSHTYRVEFREVANPEDLPKRQYVVAWTWGPDPLTATA